MTRKRKDPDATAGAQPAEEQVAAGGQAGARDTAPAEPALAAEIVVTGPRAGIRRAGRQFGPEPVRIPAGTLTEAELAALIAEPLLSVRNA